MHELIFLFDWDFNEIQVFLLTLKIHQLTKAKMKRVNNIANIVIKKKWWENHFWSVFYDYEIGAVQNKRKQKQKQNKKSK